MEGESAASLGLTGQEVFEVSGLGDNIKPRSEVTVTASNSDGSKKSIKAIARLDSAVEVNYYRNGGILPTVLRSLLKKG
jgi:aconitate hydratase